MSNRSETRKLRQLSILKQKREKARSKMPPKCEVSSCTLEATESDGHSRRWCRVHGEEVAASM